MKRNTHRENNNKMPQKAVAAEARIGILSSVLESQLLQAPHKPEALYQVVGRIWSSLVYAAGSNTATNVDHDTPSFPPTLAGPVSSKGEADSAKLAPAMSSASAGAQWEAQTISSQPSFSASAASPPHCTTACSGTTSDGHVELVAPYLEHTMAGRAASSCAAAFSDGEEVVGGRNLATNFDAMLTAATATGRPILSNTTVSTAPSSVEEWPLSTMAQPVPVAQLSPLILRLLLWWASRPQLPSLRSDICTADGCSAHDAWVPSKGSTNGSSDSGDEFVPTQQRRQREAEDAHQLRLRIAEIFDLLSRRGFGVVLSDALIYGKCHEASEAAAERCNLVFRSCANATWHAATSPTPANCGTAAGHRADTGGGGAADLRLGLPGLSPATVEAAHCVNSTAAGGATSQYCLDRLLRALLRLHTSPRGTTGPTCTVASDADVTATGQLLRALLHCPRLHKRFLRLFDSDEPLVGAPQPVFDNAPSTTLLSCSTGSTPGLGASGQMLLAQAGASEEDGAIGGSVRLHCFLPALTHPSPVVSCEAWHTLGVLLFPSANMTRATRNLLQRSPECPVQRLLAAALALPGDDDATANSSTTAASVDATLPPLLSSPSSALQRQPSHPMARNSALRILHVLCVSKDVPPTTQLLFTQCPALLWRVLRLAAELCRGNPVANMVLVRRALADYVIMSVQPSVVVGAPATPSPTQLLLRNNREALTTLFSSTYALWGMRGEVRLVATDSGGDYAEATTEAVYDEEDLRHAVQMLR